MSEKKETTKPLPTWKEFEQTLVATAIKDEAFREELLSNPKAVVEKELAKLGFSEKIPANVEFKIIEQPANILHIVLPAKEDLDNETLDNVAGKRNGCDYFWGCPHNGACKAHLLAF